MLSSCLYWKLLFRRTSKLHKEGYSCHVMKRRMSCAVVIIHVASPVTHCCALMLHDGTDRKEFRKTFAERLRKTIDLAGRLETNFCTFGSRCSTVYHGLLRAAIVSLCSWRSVSRTPKKKHGVFVNAAMISPAAFTKTTIDYNLDDGGVGSFHPKIHRNTCNRLDTCSMDSSVRVYVHVNVQSCTSTIALTCMSVMIIIHVWAESLRYYSL